VAAGHGAAEEKMVHRIFQMEHDDARALQRLGAAAVLIWSTFPKTIQEDLVRQAQAIEGMADPAAVARRIHEMVNRNQPPEAKKP
jgi:hypothetical protein